MIIIIIIIIIIIVIIIVIIITIIIIIIIIVIIIIIIMIIIVQFGRRYGARIHGGQHERQEGGVHTVSAECRRLVNDVLYVTDTFIVWFTDTNPHALTN